MTFGYNANLFKDTIQGRIAEFAENLLADLNAERFHDVTVSLVEQILGCLLDTDDAS